MTVCGDQTEKKLSFWFDLNPVFQVSIDLNINTHFYLLLLASNLRVLASYTNES